MRIILHVGMPKAGSTALQTALGAAREALREKRILYPAGALNQNFLVAGIAPPDRIGRVYAQHYDGDADAIRTDFAAFWGGILASVRSERPDVLVLSGEFLYGPLGEGGAGALAALLAPLEGRLEIVCYVRRPSDYFLSATQQRLKASWLLRPVEAVPYRPTLAAARDLAAAVHAVPFVRERFPEGDVVADFAARVLPEADGVLRTVEHRKVKPSMSAEAMAIVQAYRRKRHPDGNDRFTRDTARLIRHLTEQDAAIGGASRPRLVPAIQRAVDQSSTDLVWLRDTFGITFDGIDYGAIAPAERFTPEDVSDICIVDRDRLAALAATLDGLDLAGDRGETQAFRTAVGKRPARKEARDRGFWRRLLRLLRVR